MDTNLETWILTWRQLLTWKHDWVGCKVYGPDGKYTVFSRKLYGLVTETIRSAKVYGPPNLKVYGLIKKSIRSFSGNYTVCESIRSWIIYESYNVKTESIRSWS